MLITSAIAPNLETERPGGTRKNGHLAPFLSSSATIATKVLIILQFTRPMGTATGVETSEMSRQADQSGTHQNSIYMTLIYSHIYIFLYIYYIYVEVHLLDIPI